METSIPFFLDTRLRHPHDPVQFPVSMNPYEENAAGEKQFLKRNMGFYMTREKFDLLDACYYFNSNDKKKIGENKAVKAMIAADSNLQTELEMYNKKLQAFVSNVKAIKDGLMKRGMFSIDNWGLVLDPVIHQGSKKATMEQKAILSDPAYFFNAWEAIARIFPLSEPGLVQDAEVIEDTAPAPAPVKTEMQVIGTMEKRSPRLVNTSMQVAVAEEESEEEPANDSNISALFSLLPKSESKLLSAAMKNGELTFDNVDEFVIKFPNLAGKVLLIAQLLPHFAKGKDGRMTLDLLNFDLKANFFEFFVKSMRKKKISEARETALLNVKNIVIEFLKYDNNYQEVDGQPYRAFQDFNKPLFERMEKWMMEVRTPKLGRTSASSYLSSIRTVFHRAQARKIINENYNPFRGEDKFVIHGPEHIDRSISEKDMEKLLQYKPCIKRNWARNSEELYYDFFLMSATAYGANQMDLLSLKKSQVLEGSFSFKRAKIEKKGSNALKVTVLITPPLRALMEKWKQPDEVDSEFYFPFLNLTKEDHAKLAAVKPDPEFDLTYEDAYRRKYNAIIAAKSNQFTLTMIRYMRKIVRKHAAMKPKYIFEKKITSYSARHFFANSAINKGIHPLRVMQAMGQRSFEAFMHYVNAGMGKSDMEKMLELIEDMHKDKVIIEELNEVYVDPQLAEAA